MSKARSKRKFTSGAKKTTGRGSEASVRKTAKLKAATHSAAGQQPRSSSRQKGRSETKKARIIAMLRSPSGATIEAMVRTSGWQQHSVRGFLAGVVCKKLGLNLVSETSENGRVYRVVDRTGDANAKSAG